METDRDSRTDTSMPLLCILSVGHSGSTLLHLLLDTHSRIRSTGEINTNKKPLQKQRCACGEEARECPVWSNVLSEIESRTLMAYRSKLAFLLNIKKYWAIRKKKKIRQLEPEAYSENLAELYTRFAACQSTAAVAASTGVERFDIVQHTPRLRPVAIHLVRDSRGVVWSYRRKYKKTVPFIFKWLLGNLKIWITRKRSTVPWLLVRYEDLAADPEGTLRRITTAAGEPFEPTMLQFHNTEHHLIGGNRVRRRGGSEIREDQKWRTEMPRRHRLLTTLLAGWLNTLLKPRDQR